VIVLAGGEDLWSNGIHLNAIEASADAAAEFWANIVVMDDLIRPIILATDPVVVTVGRNVGAGGAMLPLAADLVLVREGVVLNPHHRNMGRIYGSECWTYPLPRRVGWERALALTESCLPISARRAAGIGPADLAIAGEAFDLTVQAFRRHGGGSRRDHRAQAGHAGNGRSAAAAGAVSARRADTNVPELLPTGFAYHGARNAFVFKHPACWSPAYVRLLTSTAVAEGAPPPALSDTCQVRVAVGF